MLIRSLQSEDFKDVEKLIRESFSNTEYGYENEAELVERLRQESHYNQMLEVVAIDDNQIIGHGLLSEIKVADEDRKWIGLALAPIEVSPQSQRRGYGKALIKEPEKRAVELGYAFIIILGHPEYYRKLGYQLASSYQIYAPFDVPEEAFMAKEVIDEGLQNVHGVVQYSDAFQ